LVVCLLAAEQLSYPTAGERILGIQTEIAIALFMLAKGQSQPGGGPPVHGGTMSIRNLCSFLVAAALLCPCFIPSSFAQTEAEPEAAAKVKKVTARQVLEATYAKTIAAETVDDFSEIIEQCERVLGAKLTAENSSYAHQLAAWGYNKRGESYANQAAALAEQGEERKANELDDVALADFESALTHDPKKWSIQTGSQFCSSQRTGGDYDFSKSSSPEMIVPGSAGTATRKQGNLSGPPTIMSRQLQLKPTTLARLLGRGNALRLQGVSAGSRHFGRTLQIDSDNPQARRRGDVRAEIGQWEEAAELSPGH
jgi:hypothetical protein